MEPNHPPPNSHEQPPSSSFSRLLPLPNNHEPSSSAFSRLLSPPDFSPFRDHLRPAGYMGPVYSGLSQIGSSSFQRANDYHKHPIGMHEALWRQMEKEKIREEIIAEERARRHILEAEVRRELMIERNMAMQRGGNGSLFTSHLMRSMQVDTKGFPALPPPQKMDESRSGETSGMSPPVRNEFESMETASQRVSEPRTLGFLPPSDTVKEKQKIILLAKPEEKVSDMKQKFEVLPPTVSPKRKAEVFMPVGDGELTSPGDASKKRVVEAWSCALCQVSATSERALNEHLQGKKHLAKETALRKNGKNFSIGLYPKPIPVPEKLPEIPSSTCVEKIVNFAESKDPKTATTAESNSVSTETCNNPVVLRSPKSDRISKKKEAPARKTGSKRTLEQKNFKFWCEMCQVGAYCENVMESHRKGKKHVARLLEQSNVNKPSTQVMQMNPTEGSGEVVQGSASRDLALIIEEVKLDGYKKEAGEDGKDIAPLGVAADEMELEGNQNKAVKDTLTGSLDPATFVAELEGEKKEARELDAEETKSEGSDPLIIEVEPECEQKEESIIDVDDSD